jgi:WD40-like Beta Propeller Repeat
MKNIFGIAAFCALLLCGTAGAQEFGPWSATASLGPTINSKCNDQHPALSKDGLTLVFASNRPANAADPCLPANHLWVTQRDTLDSPWEAPQPLTMLNSPFASTYEDMAANFSTDGHWLFFHSGRNDGSCGGGVRLELMAAHRKNKRDDFGWETPINLGCALNTNGADNAGPTFWEDDATGTLYLYFTRNNTPENPNGYNIYVSTCGADLDSCNRQQLWSPGAYVAELNSQGFRNTRTAIRRRDGLEMLITSNRPGTVGGLDLWVSTRGSAQDPWSVATDLNSDNVSKGGDPVVNTTANDGAPALSWDGQTMIFYSNRAGGLGGNDLYLSTRQKQPVP